MGKMSTARIADEILMKKPGYFKLSDKKKKNSRPSKGYFKLFPTEKKNIMIAFAKRNKPVHSQAYDLIRTKSKIDFSDIHDIERKIEDITFIEVKSTDAKDGKRNFANHFFGVSVNEMIMAQGHVKQYKFVFVNVKHKYILEMDLPMFFTRIKQQWHTFSFRFN
mgnify:FL=1